mgnify:CR=1 FL=1
MKILLVDDHDLVLKGMSAIFRENFPEMTVTTASSGQKAIEEIRKADTDLTVLDLELPDISGFSLIRMIRQEAPAIKSLSTQYTRKYGPYASSASAMWTESYSNR